MNARLLWFSSPLFLGFGFAAGYLQPTGKEGADTTSAPGTVMLDPRGENSHGKQGERDLGQMLLVAASHPSRLHRDHDLVEMLNRITPSGFPLVAEAALKLPKENRAAVLRALYTDWAKHDPRAASVHALKLGSEMDVMQIPLRAWIATDPAAVLSWIQQLPRSERSTASEHGFRAASEVAKDTPAAVAPLLIELSGTFVGARTLVEFFRTWSAQDPRRAAAEALSLRGGGHRRIVVEAVAESWAKRDPQGALAWLGTIPDKYLRQQTEARVLGGWAENAPEAATAYARTLPNERARNSAFAQIAMTLLKREPQAAEALAEETPLATLGEIGFYNQWAHLNVGDASEGFLQRFTALEPDARRAYEHQLKYLVRSWADASPKAAAEFATAQPEDIQRLLVENVVLGWAGKDRQAAIQWGASLPEGITRNATFSSIAEHWAHFSTNEVAAWIQTLPAGRSREAAITGFARTAVRSDPEGAFTWVRSIPDPQRSADALADVWRAWESGGGHEAAMDWLKQVQDLTPLERASLQRAERALRGE